MANKIHVVKFMPKVDIDKAIKAIKEIGGTPIGSNYDDKTVTFEAEQDDADAIGRFSDVISVYEQLETEEPDSGSNEASLNRT